VAGFWLDDRANLNFPMNIT